MCIPPFALREHARRNVTEKLPSYYQDQKGAQFWKECCKENGLTLGDKLFTISMFTKILRCFVIV